MAQAPRGVSIKMSSEDIVFATERLAVRTAEVRDVELLYELWTDPRVMVNVGFPHGLRINREEIEETLRKPSGSEFEQLLVVELKATGEPIGQCIMHYPNDEGLAETDIKLLPAFWGHKYGVEYAEAFHYIGPRRSLRARVEEYIEKNAVPLNE